MNFLFDMINSMIKPALIICGLCLAVAAATVDTTGSSSVRSETFDLNELGCSGMLSGVCRTLGYRR